MSTQRQNERKSFIVRPTSISLCAIMHPYISMLEIKRSVWIFFLDFRFGKSTFSPSQIARMKKKLALLSISSIDIQCTVYSVIMEFLEFFLSLLLNPENMTSLVCFYQLCKEKKQQQLTSVFAQLRHIFPAK